MTEYDYCSVDYGNCGGEWYSCLQLSSAPSGMWTGGFSRLESHGRDPPRVASSSLPAAGRTLHSMGNLRRVKASVSMQKGGCGWGLCYKRRKTTTGVCLQEIPVSKDRFTDKQQSAVYGHTCAEVPREGVVLRGQLWPPARTHLTSQQGTGFGEGTTQRRSAGSPECSWGWHVAGRWRLLSGAYCVDSSGTTSRLEAQSSLPCGPGSFHWAGRQDASVFVSLCPD